ncbi:cupin domain-containing protein [Halomonas sp. M5N1S17]|uniref:cupin domain-containing protein n=1 Tax=Halomonas alkalisoli TaxID=2907158 RepID=UPI001F179D5B|nr:cupin domain-containing protein [Halomonas alkalisoli]MCE9662595.1 cupin domain-containing protein [Halomonas alkalisoli]
MTTAVMLHRADGAPFTTVFRKTPLGKADPFAQQREIAWDGPEAMAVGRVSFAGELNVSSFPHTETMVVVEGELTLTEAGGMPLVVGPGWGIVVGRGTELLVQAQSGTRFVFCSAAGDAAPMPGLTPLRPDADFKPSATLPAEVLLGPAPECRSDNVFTDDHTQTLAGTWDSTAYHRIIRPQGKNEFMYLVAGSVNFASPDGGVLAASAGDALFVPKGAPVGWESRDHVAKFYVVQAVLD